MYPHRKKYEGVKFGDLRGHAIEHPVQICLETAHQERLSLGWLNWRGFTLLEDVPLWYLCDCFSRFCQPNESLSRSVVSRQMGWKRVFYHVACQVTKFDPFRFLFMGYVKDSVYQMKVQEVGGLHHQIAAACDVVTQVILQNTW
jgi:hypothetical protein